MKKSLYLLPILVVAILSSSPLFATAVISPKDVTILPNFSVKFTVKDPSYTSTTLYYKVYDSNNIEYESGSFTTDSNGEGSFQVTFNEGGTYTVKVYNDSSYSTVIATAYVEVMDIVEILWPFLAITLTLGIVMSLFKVLNKDLLKF